MAERPRYPSPCSALPATSRRASARTPQTFRTSCIPFATMDVGIVEALCDYSRPVFLFGASIRRGVSRGAPVVPSDTPLDRDRSAASESRSLDRPLRRSPRDAPSDSSSFPILPACTAGLTPPWRTQSPRSSARRRGEFVERAAPLSPPTGSSCTTSRRRRAAPPSPRPFPFRKLDDPSHFAKVLRDVSGKESVVYKCVAESDPGGFDAWLNRAIDDFGVNAYNLVGGASSANQYSGPTIPDVAAKLNERAQCAHGGVTIAERHIKKGNEHETLVKKSELGMQWFISQAIYDPKPMIKLLKEYSQLCKKKKIAPRRVILTFAPCGREKTMRFIKWLGVTVPEEVEKEILEAENKVGKSVDLLCGMCKRILEETKGCGVPLGISVESVSIFKNEIDAAHELFRRTQSMLLDFLGEPWLVRYSIVDKNAKRTSFDYGSKVKKVESTKMLPMPASLERSGSAEAGDKKGLVLGGAGLVLGFLLGKVIRL